MLIITMQYPLGVPPVLRTNIDFVFILREPNGSNRKKIWENYASMFTEFKVFEKVMLGCTENYECLVINNNSKSNDLIDQVFWYKALSHPDFRLGSEEFWQLSKQIEDNSGDDYAAYQAKNAKAPPINIRKSNNCGTLASRP
jgi:hypothetical protein